MSNVPQPTRTPFSGFSQPMQNYLFYVGLCMILPLLPLGIELIFMKKLSEQSMVLAAAMYTIGLGVVSRSILIFGTALLLCIIFSCFFGGVMKEEHEKNTIQKIAIERQQSGDKTPVPGIDRLGEDAVPWSRILAGLAIALVAVLHGIERYNRHVIDLEPVLEFSTL
ncbi:MAG: hypothetical protein ACJ8C4_15615 [Gemmataceae bacterium]